MRVLFQFVIPKTLLLNPTRLKAAGGGAAAEGGDAAGAGARCQDPLVVIPNTVSGKRYTALSTTFFSQKKVVFFSFPLCWWQAATVHYCFFLYHLTKGGRSFHNNVIHCSSQ